MKIRWDWSKNSATPPLSLDCWRLVFSAVAYFNTVANDKCYSCGWVPEHAIMADDAL